MAQDTRRRLAAPPTTPEPTLYSINEVAALWSVSRDFVERLMARGKLRYVRVESLRRIPSDALREYIEANAEA